MEKGIRGGKHLLAQNNPRSSGAAAQFLFAVLGDLWEAAGVFIGRKEGIKP